MNKLGLVLSLAAVAAVSGCLDPQYKSKRSINQGTTVVKPAEPVTPVKKVEETPPPPPPHVVVEEVEDKKVKPVEEDKPVVKEPEFTTYIIQRGDTLSKISKRYNIKIDAIKANNPQIKNDVVRLGQKIKLPGNVDVGDQKVPEGSFASPTAKPKAKPAQAPKAYTGATKEYVVKNGDTLGGIAIASGLTVRQLKELNGLSKDMIRVGQKLKVPATKVEKSPVKSEKKASKPVEKKAAVKPEAKPAEEAVDNKVPVAEPESAVEQPEQPVVEPEEPKKDEAKAKYVNYTVQEDDDIIGISIRENLSAAQIREINNLPEDVVLKPGMVIKLPVPQL